MKKFLLLYYSLLFFPIVAQENLVGNKETLLEVAVGNAGNQVSYKLNGEDINSPEGPCVDASGDLVFFPKSDKTKIQVYKQGVFFDSPFPKGIVADKITNKAFCSQQGIVITPSGYELLIKTVDDFYYYYYKEKINSYFERDLHVPMPSGAILYSSNQKTGIAILIDVQYPAEEFSVVPQEKLAAWLPTQPGGFSIGDDGLLYRNGILWSAMKPKESGYKDRRYLGRLMSGHPLWCSGPPEYSNYFIITDPAGNIELTVTVPAPTRFNYGLGPWGELYYLFAPPMDKRLDPLNDYYKPEPGVPAELVVVRNHLKYFGRLNDDNVRLRKEPNTSSDILGTYPNKTGFRILETGTKEETIGGKKSVWYKVRLLDGKEGWFFGTFVHNLYDGPNGKPPPWPNVPDW